MKKTVLFAILVTLFSVILCAQNPEYGQGGKVKFAYDATFDTYFDNVENDGGGNIYGQSLTLFTARLTPEVGFKAITDGRRGHEWAAHHKVMAGVNIAKDFGSKETPGQMFKEITIYYNLTKKVSRNCVLEMNAGIFPRTAGKGRYSEVFFSDSLRFYDPNHEGLLFGFNRPKAYFELGVDWLGQIGTDASTREKFMVFSAGNGAVLPWLSLGYSGYMLHYANSLEVRGLVDNILLSGYAEMDFGPMIGIQRLAFNAAYVQALQRVRLSGDGFTFPMGGEFTEEIRHWNVTLRNKTYVGYSLMPYYNDVDAGDIKYGNNLYYGDPYYRVAPEKDATMESGRIGVYDRLEASWEPRIAAGLYFKVGAIFRFNGGAGNGFGFSGSNQVIALRFNLDELMKHHTTPHTTR